MSRQGFFMSTVRGFVDFGPILYTPPLDVFNNSIAAFSVRKIRTAYTGPCMRIANAAGVELDIGFRSNGYLDVTAIESHCGVISTSKGWIKKWYDQSGSANDALGSVTLTNNLLIYAFADGGILMLNSNPALSRNNDTSQAKSKYLELTTRVQVGAAFIVGNTVLVNNTSFQYIGWSATDSDGIFIAGSNASATGLGIVKTGALTALKNNTENINQRLWEYIGSATDFVYTDGANSASGTITNPFIKELGRTLEGSGGIDLSHYGFFQEYLIFSDDKTASRTSIESNINSYYSIY